jgi:hypothetical protein
MAYMIRGRDGRLHMSDDVGLYGGSLNRQIPAAAAGGAGNRYAGMPTTGIKNPFAVGAAGKAFPFGDLVYHAPTKAQGYNANAFSPMVGSYSYEPRQQLAQIMSQRPPSYVDRSGPGGGGYSTSGPQSGGFGYGGGMGGWGWGGGARSSATRGGMWGGLY